MSYYQRRLPHHWRPEGTAFSGEVKSLCGIFMSLFYGFV
jgi:hypothetical protein